MTRDNGLNGRLVVLLGGSGFLGRYVAQALLERGARVRIASRDPHQAWSLKPLANLGQLQFAPCDIRHDASLAAALAGGYAAVNLLASWSGDQMALMGRAHGNAALLAAQEGVRAYMEISGIGADPQSPSGYGQAKALGEQLVREALPGATIVRPSVIFGKDDSFISMFAQLIQLLRVLPVFGPDARLQPVYVDDVAEAVATALASPERHGGKTYELGGPQVLTMMDIHRQIAGAQRRKRTFVPMPDMVSSIFAALPGTPMSSDQWAMLKAGNVISGKHPGLKQMGIDPKPLGLFLDKWMTRYRKHGRFAERLSA